jgi:hypothetical protein
MKGGMSVTPARLMLRLMQVRTIAGDLVEEVKLIDNFTHPKTVGGGPASLQL